MASINGYNTDSYSCTGLINLKADEVNATSINCETFLDQDSNLFSGITSNLQSQLNSINGLVTSGGGGCFAILATQNSGFVANSYWGYSSGTNPTVNNPLVFGYNFKVTSITFICQTIPTTSATVLLYKNGSSVYTMDTINALSKTFSNINIDFLAGDTFNIFTSAGVGGTMIRCTVSCQVGGITGATPQLSIGTVSNLASGSTATVSITGTTLNPVLNFGLVQGQAGINGTNGANGSQGPKGDTGAQGPQGPKGDKGDDGGLDPVTAGVITGLVATVGGLVTAVATIEGEIVTIEGEIGTIQGEITTIDEEITALQGKTQYITADTVTVSTTINSSLNVGTNSFKVNATTGLVENRGDITVKNASGGSTITLESETGNITCNQVSCSTGSIDALTTNGDSIQNIYGSTVNIGTTGINNVNIGSASSAVFINGLIYLPFSSATSFFSQW
jgi:hypothetical protein